MGFFDFLRRRALPASLDVPVFPLNTVLFPGGLVTLKLFEQRYLDMAAACMKEQKPFGVCLIAAGGETGTPAEPHPIGTLAEIASWEMPQLGILVITARGGQRFRILEKHVEPDKLLRAKVEPIPETAAVPVPPERLRLLPLLKRIVNDLGAERMPEPHYYDDAQWVGCRLTEILPVQNLAKQKLLELDDPLTRLEILEKYLEQRKLLS
ncbi:MAG: peptidase [Rhodocyclaceae bacterium]|nr:peptidase [Rhodocyclaceae bacterium]